MSLPTPKDAHKDAALSNIAIGYRNPMFIADRVFPHVVVAKQSDYFFKFLKKIFKQVQTQPKILKTNSLFSQPSISFSY